MLVRNDTTQQSCCLYVRQSLGHNHSAAQLGCRAYTGSSWALNGIDTFTVSFRLPRSLLNNGVETVKVSFRFPGSQPICGVDTPTVSKFQGSQQTSDVDTFTVNYQLPESQQMWVAGIPSIRQLHVDMALQQDSEQVHIVVP